MSKGMHFWKNNGENVLLDADNLFWAVVHNQNNNADVFIPSDIFSLYEKVKNRLQKEFNDFRFGQELTAIYINPTDKCNATCSYCYIPAPIRQNGRSMTKDELFFILDKIAAYFKNAKRKQVIIFHASEPLLVKEIIFEAITKYKKVFKFGLQTNALLLEKTDAEFLKDHLVGIGISLDSSVPSINNRLRPQLKEGGNFSKAVKAIEWFGGYAGLNVITTITKLNVASLPSLVKFLHAKRVPCVLMNPVRFTRSSMRMLKPDDKILAKYFIRAVDTAITLSQKSKHKIIIGNFTNAVLAIIAPLARRLMCDISPCGGGRCFFTITASGKMIPCGEFIGLEGFSGGSIFKQSISTAMRSKAFKKVRDRAVEKIQECKACNLRNICGAPCPAELHSLGTMYQKSIFCDFYKEIIKYAFTLIAQDKIRYILRKDAIGHLNYEYNLDSRLPGSERTQRVWTRLKK
ncbi:MAG: peptide-modifying radical SAM enzyme CbpB [Candidatus Omnitrophota bacterium]|nr:peptide-modifying radical SAM enzyme CbpB [Candidatus Omnitrophota bacterium]